MLEQWTWGEKQNKRKQQQKIVFQNRIPVRGDPHILIVGDPGLGKSQVRLIISWSVTVAFCNHSPWLLLIQSSFCFRRVVYHADTSCDFGWFRHHVLFKESDLQNKPFMWCALGKWFILQTLHVISVDSGIIFCIRKVIYATNISCDVLWESDLSNGLYLPLTWLLSRCCRQLHLSHRAVCTSVATPLPHPAWLWVCCLAPAFLCQWGLGYLCPNVCQDCAGHRFTERTMISNTYTMIQVQMPAKNNNHLQIKKLDKMKSVSRKMAM